MTVIPTPASFDVQNYFQSVLTANVLAVDTDIFLDPVPTPTQGFLVIDPDNAATREIIFYSSKTATKVSVPNVTDGRGYDSTSPLAHAAGVKVIMAPVAQMIRGILDGSLVNDAARLYSLPHSEDSTRFVVTGCVPSGTVGQQTITVSAGTAYYLGRKYTVSSTALSTVGFSSATLKIYLLIDTANGTATPSATTGTIPAASLNLGLVTTDASALIATITTGGATGTSGPFYNVLRGNDFPQWRVMSPTTITGLTIGNGTGTGRSKRIGNTCFVQLRVTLGSTSVVTGALSFNNFVGANPLPSASQTTTYDHPTGAPAVVGQAAFWDSSATTTYDGVVYFSGAGPHSTVQIAAKTVSGANIIYTAISSTVPFTWATGDVIDFYMIYECAN